MILRANGHKRKTISPLDAHIQIEWTYYGEQLASVATVCCPVPYTCKLFIHFSNVSSAGYKTVQTHWIQRIERENRCSDANLWSMITAENSGKVWEK